MTKQIYSLLYVVLLLFMLLFVISVLLPGQNCKNHNLSVFLKRKCTKFPT